MKLFIFRCRARPKTYGATRFETGSNLPTDRFSGEWEFCKRVELAVRGTVPFAVDADTLRREVQQKGWYVWDESRPESLRGVVSESTQAPREEQRPPVQTAETEIPPARTAKTPPPAAAELRTPSVAMIMPPNVETAPGIATLPVQHQVVWFDIPVRDLDRAVRFYSAVLGTQLKKEQTGPGAAIAILPHAGGSIGGCLVLNADARPSEGGPLLYLNTHDRLDEALNAVEKHSGRVLSARHSIAPFGFRAIVLDSEGNRIALHSM